MPAMPFRYSPLALAVSNLHLSTTTAKFLVAYSTLLKVKAVALAALTNKNISAKNSSKTQLNLYLCVILSKHV
jgi:hypothetical protein